MQALIDSTRFEADDPRSVLAVVSVRLAVSLDSAPSNVALARELRTHAGRRQRTDGGERLADVVVELLDPAGDVRVVVVRC